ncbi:MAG TPA: M48 family metallopeptidase [Chitinophagales bacterium]|nr:M48 family metallopeptidase [Chitinophagales bacterium]
MNGDFMPSPSALLWLVIAFLLLEYLLSRVLDFLNARNWSPEIPAEMQGYIDRDKYLQARNYDRAKKRLEIVTGTCSLALIIILLLIGAFGLLDGWVRQFTDSPVLMALIFFGILYVMYDLIALPFSIYDTFVIEERFGFNKTTPAIFIKDKIKSYLLSAVLGGSILALIIFLYEATGEWFWLLAWCATTLFMLFLTFFYTTLIVPLFNKLTPLDAGELHDAIQRYAQKVNFPLKNIYVMDSSKRTTKSNAYFSGIGAKKTIVLFDTLIKNHTAEEVVAILAHEVGHYKKKHIRNSLLLSTLQTGILLFIFGKFAGSTTLAAMMGSEHASFHIGLLAFSLLLNPVTLVLGILMNIYSRKNEFEADAFAKETFAGAPLQEALKKLSVHNLSNLRPHPAYVFFRYSHPPLLERLKALNAG